MNIDEATAKYWEVKRAYYGRTRTMTTEQALNDLRHVLETTGPHHPLANQAFDLQQCIITGSNPS
ncbi:hypothetical protein LCGC14_1739730 [marine sediment metagenome]|uniref:Uncharacterized protein n=1 Tax=marine sediment metagenome TaxID=412755 RepID=A0A0F9H707_9ZZZZ